MLPAILGLVALTCLLAFMLPGGQPTPAASPVDDMGAAIRKLGASRSLAAWRAAEATARVEAAEGAHPLVRARLQRDERVAALRRRVDHQ